MQRVEDMFGNQLGQLSESNSQNFMEETNFQHFIDLIGGETRDPIVNFCLNYECEHISGCLDNTQFGPAPPDNYLLDDFNLDSALNGFPLVDGDFNKDEEEDNDFGEESSATTTMTTTTQTKRKGDRSRTLISERGRRGRMKEKLYALRALVPNITKMDKASIVGDAVLYLQELQMQAKKLRAEIAGLESSLMGGDGRQKGVVENQKNTRFANRNHLMCKKIIQLSMFQVEERGFYVRVECSRGQGVAVSLYKALESLTRFSILGSNLATLVDKFIFTFTLKVRESDPVMDLPNLKLWVTGAFSNQGFEFQPQQST